MTAQAEHPASYSYEALAVTRDEHGVRVITLNRPERLNAMNETMKKELKTALRESAKDESVRCLVLRGAGERAFCSGQDLKEHAGTGRSLKESLRLYYNPIVLSIRTMQKPVVAMINGVAAGAGCSLALNAQPVRGLRTRRASCRSGDALPRRARGGRHPETRRACQTACRRWRRHRSAGASPPGAQSKTQSS